MWRRRLADKHFRGKDDLIAETLRATAEIDLQRYREGLASGGDDPRSRVLAVFEQDRADNHRHTIPRMPLCRRRARPHRSAPPRPRCGPRIQGTPARPVPERARGPRPSSARTWRRPNRATDRRRADRRRDPTRDPPRAGSTRARRTHSRHRTPQWRHFAVRRSRNDGSPTRSTLTAR